MNKNKIKPNGALDIKIQISPFCAGLLLAAALGSNATGVFAQESDDGNLHGAGGVTSDPQAGARGGQVKKFSMAINKTPRSVIDADLQEELDQLESNDLIEVTVYLDTMIDEESDFSSSARAAYLEGTHQIDEAEVLTNDPQLNQAIEGLNHDDKLALVEEKRAAHTQQKRLKREEKFRKTVDKLLDKLQQRKFERLVSFNQSAGIFTAHLRKNDVLKLARSPRYILSITPYSEDQPALESAVTESRLNTTSWPVSRYGGQGVGIYMREGPNTCFDESEVKPIEDLIGLGGGGTYNFDRASNPHGIKVAQALRAASPQSDIYCSAFAYYVPSKWADDIHVVNYSWVHGSSYGSREWDANNAAADKYSYNQNVQVFASTGNDCKDVIGSVEGCEVRSPAKSHNALGIGAYDDTTDRMASFSNWIDPVTGATKPELLAPGVSLNFAGGQPNGSGTSFSAPLAAGMAASNISLMPMMKKHPALIKASMLAMAAKNRISDNGDSRANGARAIQWNPDGLYNWWDEPNSFLNDADGQWKQLTTLNLRAEEYVKIVLSWSNREEVCDGVLSNGDSYDNHPSHLCMGLAMQVIDPSGNRSRMANTQNRNWQELYMVTPVSGEYKVYVYRTRNFYERHRDDSSAPWNYQYNRAKLGIRAAYIENR